MFLGTNNVYLAWDVNFKYRKEENGYKMSFVVKRKLKLLGLGMYGGWIKSSTLKQNFCFESCLRYVLPAKGATFNHDISINDVDAVNRSSASYFRLRFGGLFRI